MKDSKSRTTVDLLDLSQKERMRLCREIRTAIQHKIVQEKG